MNRIDRRFSELKKRNETALIPFISAGDPSPEVTGAILDALVEGGADIIELGMPFSDPTADGPTIQLSSQRALKAGMTREKLFEIVEEFRSRHDIPIVLFGYYNPIFVAGSQNFINRAREAGVDGLLIVDLPPEESGEIQPYLHETGMYLIRLATPTSSEQRLSRIDDQASGFLYYVTMTGVTGTELEVNENLIDDLLRVKQQSSLPVAAGFGISTPKQAAAIGKHADGVVVGSAIVRLIAEGGDAVDICKRVKAFVASLKQVL